MEICCDNCIGTRLHLARDWMLKTQVGCISPATPEHESSAERRKLAKLMRYEFQALETMEPESVFDISAVIEDESPPVSWMILLYSQQIHLQNSLDYGQLRLWTMKYS
jgi:hypothetical protein